MTQAVNHHDKATESKYQGSAEEMYVTYDLQQATRGGARALYPEVKRVYIAGTVTHWHVGTFAKRTGKTVHGVKIDYTQSRQAYARKRGIRRRAAGPNTPCSRRTCGRAKRRSPRSSRCRKRPTTCSSMPASSRSTTTTRSRTCAKGRPVLRNNREHRDNLHKTIGLRCYPASWPSFRVDASMTKGASATRISVSSTIWAPTWAI